MVHSDFEHGDAVEVLPDFYGHDRLTSPYGRVGWTAPATVRRTNEGHPGYVRVDFDTPHGLKVTDGQIQDHAWVRADQITRGAPDP